MFATCEFMDKKLLWIMEPEYMNNLLYKLFTFTEGGICHISEMTIVYLFK